MLKIIFLSFLILTPSVSANRYIITKARMESLVTRWNKGLREIHGIIPGVSYFFDAQGKRLDHDLISNNTFKHARGLYLASHSSPSVQGFVSYLSGTDSLLDNDPLLMIYQERSRNFSTSSGVLAYRMNGDIRVDLRLLCFFLSLSYTSYMLIGEMAPREFPASLRIFIEIINDDVRIATDYI